MIPRPLDLLFMEVDPTKSFTPTIRTWVMVATGALIIRDDMYDFVWLWPAECYRRVRC